MKVRRQYVVQGVGFSPNPAKMFLPKIEERFRLIAVKTKLTTGAAGPLILRSPRLVFKFANLIEVAEIRNGSCVGSQSLVLCWSLCGAAFTVGAAPDFFCQAPLPEMVMDAQFTVSLECLGGGNDSFADVSFLVELLEADNDEQA